MSRRNSVMLSAMPCAGDSNEELHAMLEPWMGDVPELLDNGIVIDATLRAMRLLFTGDLAFYIPFWGHQGPTARMPCVWCSALSRASAVNADRVADHGHLQAAAVRPAQLRTREHLQKMIEACANQGNHRLVRPLSPAKHLSIEACRCSKFIRRIL